MTYSDAVIKRLTQLCDEKKITVNGLANLSGITQPTDFQEWLSYVRQESLQKPQYCSSRI